MNYKSQIYRFLFSTENFLCFAAAIQILNYNPRLKYQRINHTKTNKDVNKQDNLISCNIGKKNKEKTTVSRLWREKRLFWSRPSSPIFISLFKMQQKHPLPPPPLPPPHYILTSLHPSVPDPCSQSASRLSEAIGFRPRPRELLQERRSGTAL